MAAHETVLRQEAVDALVLKASGSFVDCTYGRGGHSELILGRLDDRGRLMVIDKDQAAIDDARSKFAADGRVIVVQGSFAELARFAEAEQLAPLDGILIDLGVSSPQLDEAERGFSFMQPGPLDMRMDQGRGETAAEWLNRAEERDIAHVIRKYGEEKFARRIAREIVQRRELVPFATTTQLVEAIEEAIPARQQREQKKHPATRTFQAIRIFINDELGDLETCLAAVVSLLAPGGRLVVISFHSLEDRIVKRFIRDMARGEMLPSKLPIRDADIKRHLKIVGKPVKPSDDEVERNRRSRSSIMRVAEKL